ncbi:DUF4129 domain-containing protein [Gordonia sp. NPDC003429]
MIRSVLALDPDNDTARRWSQDELSRAEYQPPDQRSGGVLDTIRDWLSDRFADIFGVAKPVPVIIAIVVGVLVVLLVIYGLRFVRRVPKHERSDRRRVLDETPHSARQLRARAEELLAAGDADGCVREAMRALTRRAAERGLLTDAPSLTAHEVAAELSRHFPDDRSRLTEAGNLFDAVRYGGRHATADQARSLLDLESVLAERSPHTGPIDPADAGFAVPR